MPTPKSPTSVLRSNRKHRGTSHEPNAETTATKNLPCFCIITATPEIDPYVLECIQRKREILEGCPSEHRPRRRP